MHVNETLPTHARVRVHRPRNQKDTLMKTTRRTARHTPRTDPSNKKQGSRSGPQSAAGREGVQAERRREQHLVDFPDGAVFEVLRAVLRVWVHVSPVHRHRHSIGALHHLKSLACQFSGDRIGQGVQIPVQGRHDVVIEDVREDSLVCVITQQIVNWHISKGSVNRRKEGVFARVWIIKNCLEALVGVGDSLGGLEGCEESR
mmetsp:Transcript_19881/g.48236  ORF Transcript_19881/g.48236 Transcript_19881/m.48236 type:complete len:202 (-) Transcript_19881:219-824(-)